MAGQDKLGGVPALQVSKCHLETGRKRPPSRRLSLTGYLASFKYRLRRDERIPYEESPHAAQEADSLDEGVQNEDDLGGGPADWEWFDDMMGFATGPFDEQSDKQSDEFDEQHGEQSEQPLDVAGHHDMEDASTDGFGDDAPASSSPSDGESDNQQIIFLIDSDDESHDDDELQSIMSDDELEDDIPDIGMGIGNDFVPIPNNSQAPNVPPIAEWRLNLTALSQKYNLYFAAYSDKIHVSRPRSCSTHDLPSKPDLVLKPARSAAARYIIGTINPGKPHEVNHLIVGDLGLEEILLMAHDDGDVTGYYTKEIENEIAAIETSQKLSGYVVKTKPFFQENVGKSAWGLSIHMKSRLIAVGSNLHAVTVFAPALSLESPEPDVLAGSFWQSIKKTLDGSAVEFPETLRACFPTATGRVLKQRTCNWKITLDTSPAGSNIPNLTFSNDKDGNADKVVAVDIEGNLWLMNIWSFDVPFQKIPSLHRRSRRTDAGQRGPPRGWGVLVLPASSFLTSNNCYGTLGLPSEEVRRAQHPSIGSWLDISKAITYIPQNALYYPRSGGARRPTPAEIKERNENLSRNMKEMNRKIDLDWWFQQYSPGQALDTERMATSSTLDDGSSILRLYETGIELRPHEKDKMGIMMQYAMNQVFPTPTNSVAFQFDQQNRLANYHFIPELSLVVAGSMSGRVALVTLTCDQYGQRGFKVELILPLKKDEEDQLRPLCPLYGVAVGPLPVGDRSEAHTPSMSRRYRIMMQYYDHNILSYEFSRGMESDVLTII
ncbi:hypothetical protein PFICI_01403 [Pestalotiopsis fici W106-1]|uniref:Uncharacterized protein n=1 Tax=Pestalotiopsis fici (strain W106-1 / CGMCC3.15140) TaxID=1229662 RepID=W3XNP4_PESFW|nr:uncharacterized protein PFICI_01403 [Pestalotiopsis fici W106-1]ETS87575.1 hypothetical protein PFICI_01403 [Pestalotiopsis fici W106-1]